MFEWKNCKHAEVYVKLVSAIHEGLSIIQFCLESNRCYTLYSNGVLDAVAAPLRPLSMAGTGTCECAC